MATSEQARDLSPPPSSPLSAANRELRQTGEFILVHRGRLLKRLCCSWRTVVSSTDWLGLLRISHVLHQRHRREVRIVYSAAYHDRPTTTSCAMIAEFSIKAWYSSTQKGDPARTLVFYGGVCLTAHEGNSPKSMSKMKGASTNEADTRITTPMADTSSPAFTMSITCAGQGEDDIYQTLPDLPNATSTQHTQHTPQHLEVAIGKDDGVGRRGDGQHEGVRAANRARDH